jgi:heme iron utilization protein
MTSEPIRETDDAARDLARTLLMSSHSASLATLEANGHPSVSLVSVALDAAGAPLILVSRLSNHTTHLLRDPRCALLVSMGGKGDPLAHPRMTLNCHAIAVPTDAPGRDELRTRFLVHNPKAELYVDFPDFLFFVLEIRDANLNGGFGKAYRLVRSDLALPGSEA